MTQSDSSSHVRNQPAFEQRLFEAFQARQQRNPHWADGLIHLLPHDQFHKLSYHHQHSQYHLVLFWLENLFPHAARWLGVRDLARLALDFLENKTLTTDQPEALAEQFIDSLASKRELQTVAQLECLMRCGLARWRLLSSSWRADLADVSRRDSSGWANLLEYRQIAFVESTGDWSIVSLWMSIEQPKNPPQAIDPQVRDAIAFYRPDEFTIEFERVDLSDLPRLMTVQRE